LLNIIAVVMVVAIFALVSISLTDFSAKLDDIVRGQTEVYLTESAIQSASLFDAEMGSAISSLNCWLRISLLLTSSHRTMLCFCCKPWCWSPAFRGWAL
jgi:hypothetical protein